MDTKQLLSFGLDMILPPSCVICRARLSAQGLCGTCWAGLQPITDPLCSACGRPLPHAMRTDLCGACHNHLPIINPLRALYRYNEVTRRLVVPFKHNDRLDMLPVLQRMLAPLFADMTETNPLVVPVPLHRWRFFTRRYNQAAELARALCQNQNITHLYQPDLLFRQKHTVSMGRLSRTDRAANVKRAFRTDEQTPQLAAGRNILLIDDVMTTGATLESCARCLRAQTTCKDISALVFARVI